MSACPRLLLFPQREYPSDHAMLETIYTRLLPARGYAVTMIMRRKTSMAKIGHANWNGIPVYLLPPYTPRRGWKWPLAMIQHTFQSYQLARFVLSQQPVDFIQVRNELADALAMLWLKRKWKVPFVYQLSFPEIAAGLERPSVSRMPRLLRRANARLQQILQDWVLRQADLVLAISDQMRAELIRQGLRPERVLSFPLGVDTDLPMNAEAGRRLRERLGLDEALTIIYFGTLDRLRRLDFLLEVMQQVLKKVPSARLLMLGSASTVADEEWLKLETQARGLEAVVRFVAAVPRGEVPAYLAAAHISVSPIPPLPIYTVSSPTKVVESLGLARPVVANLEIADQAQIITESGGGLCVPYQVNAFAEAIVQLLLDPDCVQRMGEHGRDYILRARSYRVLAEKIDDRYRTLLARSGGQTAC